MIKIFRYLLFSLFAFILFECQSQDKVLILYQGNYTEETKYKILNSDKSQFAEIKSVDGNEPSCSKLKGKILAYFDDYYIFHFRAKQSILPNYFEVQIGSVLKLIEKSNTMMLLSLEDYILKYYCSASKQNPLKISPNEKSKSISVNFEDVGFICLEIKGDWVKVKCNKECESCPNGKNIEGWIRWRRNDKIILKQYYNC
ncbi:hypothetical protein [Flectobacillus major]|uniref:hypothetical protein n=1 Tax=Flectobacillus major TaxID=103 RepID=UPI00040F693A|nr:hypothetical protein [Flectobacillus major]